MELTTELAAWIISGGLLCLNALTLFALIYIVGGNHEVMHNMQESIETISQFQHDADIKAMELESELEKSKAKEEA